MTDAGEKLVEAVARYNAEAGGFDWDAMGVYQEYYLSAARRNLAAIDAAGWQIVPKVPTEEMWQAGEYAWMHRRLDDEASEPLTDCYRAMLAAAPKVVP